MYESVSAFSVGQSWVDRAHTILLFFFFEGVSFILCLCCAVAYTESHTVYDVRAYRLRNYSRYFEKKKYIKICGGCLQ